MRSGRVNCWVVTESMRFCQRVKSRSMTKAEAFALTCAVIHPVWNEMIKAATACDSAIDVVGVGVGQLTTVRCGSHSSRNCAPDWTLVHVRSAMKFAQDLTG